MSAPTTHTTPDGCSFRISNIQAVRDQSLFKGQKFTFQVENEAAEAGSSSFEVTVAISPIAYAIASPEDRMKTDHYAEALVKRTLDNGNLQDLDIEITSDGAVMVGEHLIDRVYPLVAAG